MRIRINDVLGNIVELNTGHCDCISGLFIRKDVLNAYLKANGYVMFYYALGEKVHRLGSANAIMKDISGAFQYNPEGELVSIQPMRLIERELPKRHIRDQERIDGLKMTSLTRTC